MHVHTAMMYTPVLHVSPVYHNYHDNIGKSKIGDNINTNYHDNLPLMKLSR